jgi:YegS/Rv2252/BmrU family lipid kinase
MTRYYVIINPTAGKGSGELAFPAVQAQLQALNLDFEMVRTTARGHAIQLAKEAALAGWDVVVAVGGDGTMNEVLNGLVQAKKLGASPAVLGQITVGRGNDFGFGAGIPHDLEAACAALAQGRRKRIDVGFVQGGDFPNGRYFGNGVGIGFDAVVGFVAAKQKRLSGFLSYIVAALKTMFLYFHAPLVQVELNGETRKMSALMISVMNGRRMGGGFMMAPTGSMEDGAFTCCLVDQVSRPAILGLIPKFMQGTQVGHPAVHMENTPHLVVTALKGTLPAHADGETICEAGQKLEMSLHPGLLEVIVPTA